MRIGIFGGTFDPPHLGHLILAGEARYQLNLERVLWVLTAQPPHKTGVKISSLDDRLDMLFGALVDNPYFELSRVDIDRPPPHYAVDTVRLIRQQHPADVLVYLMGADSLRDLPTWHDPLGFVQACDELGVMHRPGYQPDLEILEAQIPGLRARLHFFDAPLLEISSTGIRLRASTGAPFRYYVPDPVYQIILSRNLYQPVES